MSLDVYLEGPAMYSVEPSSGIFIREDGAIREISREEWDRRFPDREPVTVIAQADDTPTLYHGNITHNLNVMAEKAGIYGALWRPEEEGLTKAKDLIAPLEKGLADLNARPAYFRTFDSPNGWGTYPNFVDFVRKYLVACKEYPEADVKVWR